MPTLTTKAEYKNGVVIPQIRPSFGAPDEVIVKFVKLKIGKFLKPVGNGFAILNILKKYQGILPKTFPSGNSYISNLRKTMSKNWEKRLKF